MLGLCYCARCSRVAESRRYSLVVVLRLLIEVASHNGVPASGHAGFSSCGPGAQLWLPGPRAQAQEA